MSVQQSQETSRQFDTMRWVTLAFSVFFTFVIANGYYTLFLVKGAVFALAIGGLLAFIAWSLGKFIGNSVGGISRHLPLFILLLGLSAVGVFNSLMINLEGKRIFQEAIEDASAKFKQLPIDAKKALRNGVIEAKMARVDSLKKALEQEILNPKNCGEGPEAKRIMVDIAKELPGFQVLSGANENCEGNEKLIEMYNVKIDGLLQDSDEFTKENYKELLKTKADIIATEASAQAKLDKLQSEINNGASLVGVARPQLEELASTYQKHALDLANFAPGLDVPKSLDMQSIRNLGEWSQVINLILSRLDKPSTYVYLAIAVFADFMIIYLFSQLAALRRALPQRGVRPRAPVDIVNPW